MKESIPDSVLYPFLFAGDRYNTPYDEPWDDFEDQRAANEWCALRRDKRQKTPASSPPALDHKTSDHEGRGIPSVSRGEGQGIGASGCGAKGVDGGGRDNINGGSGQPTEGAAERGQDLHADDDEHEFSIANAWLRGDGRVAVDVEGKADAGDGDTAQEEPQDESISSVGGEEHGERANGGGGARGGDGDSAGGFAGMGSGDGQGGGSGTGQPPGIRRQEADAKDGDMLFVSTARVSPHAISLLLPINNISLCSLETSPMLLASFFDGGWGVGARQT